MAAFTKTANPAAVTSILIEEYEYFPERLCAPIFVNASRRNRHSHCRNRPF